MIWARGCPRSTTPNPHKSAIRPHGCPAQAEITALGHHLCQAGHVEDDTIAAPAIGHREDDERLWVLAISYDGDSLPGDSGAVRSVIAETHGGIFDTRIRLAAAHTRTAADPAVTELKRHHIE